MTTFGQQLRTYRRQCQDPLRGGALTQVRLGELLGDELGDMGYSGAAISDWERDQSKINADDRLVLVSLIAVLHRGGGLPTLAEANQFLRAGNYRALDDQEQCQIFPGAKPVPPAIPETTSSQSPVSLTPERRKQLILLEKVKRFWVEGVLEKSVQGSLLLNLNGRSYDDAVDQPWKRVIGSVPPLPVETETAVSPPSLSALFHQSDRALLILGEPGSGKTTTLIRLTLELIAQAETDPEQPIPVIFNLVSWAEKRNSLDEWIVEELTAKYQIPNPLGQQWLAEDALVLLLDGLDEVPANHRDACVDVLNQFRQQHGLIGLVVSSRREAYEALPGKLQLSRAYLLQPLTARQIDAYLAAAGERLLGLRTAVQHDPTLQEMAQTPLTLHVLCVAYWQNKTVLTEDGGLDTTEVFDTYVQAMFARRGKDGRYSPAEIKQGLNWLARQMDKHHQALFLIEGLQPSWLHTRGWQRAYILGSRLFAGLFAGVLMWLFWLMVRVNVPQFGTAWALKVGQAVPGPAAETDLWLMLFLGLSMGLVTAVLDSIDYKRISDQAYPVVDTQKRRHHRTAVTVMTTGLLATLFVGILDSPFLALSLGVVVGVTFGLITYFVYGSNLRDDIRTVSALSWSWSGMGVGLLIGLGLATAVEIMEFLLYGTTKIVQTFVSLGLVFLLLGGLRGQRVTTTSKPNQGIRLSAANALIAGGILGLTMTVITAVLWQNAALGVIAGILSALVSLFMFGGGNVANHYFLRLLLSLTKDLPGDLADFLEFCVDRVFLHRVGGGYLFIHQEIQEYFARQPAGQPADNRGKIRKPV
ncbi:MAG: NACHT domain-containing protein [Chloroflexota bacterium]